MKQNFFEKPRNSLKFACVTFAQYCKLRSTLFPHSYNKLFDFSFSRRASIYHTGLVLLWQLTVLLSTKSFVYFNIKRIQPPKKNCNQQDVDINLAQKLAGVTVREDWKMVQDKPNRISFVRLEKWEFQNRRVSMVVVVSQTVDLTYLTIRTHG